MIFFYPGPAAGLALVSGFAIVPVLVFLSHGALRIDSAQRRFLATVAFCVFAWIICVGIMTAGGIPVAWHDALAGVMLLITAIVAFGILWSLVCWGFTTSLLAALCAIEGAASRDDWFRAYGGGSSVDDFADDRLSVLLGLGLARMDGASVTLSGKAGRAMAGIVLALRRFYGLADG